jgi:hypothetical protein
MAQLALTNIVNISVSQAGAGIGEFNTSNLGLFTRDVPGGGFGSDGYKLYLEPTEVGVDFGTGSATYKMAVAIFSQKPSILQGGGYLAVIPFLALETIDDAIVRTKDLVQYFGILEAEIPSQVDMLAAAAIVQALNKIYFTVSKTAVDLDSGGKLDLLATGGFSQTRGLFYKNADVLADSLVMCASYASRGLSTDFSGSNTTQNMHMKDLLGVQPDSAMTQTLLQKAQDAGVDVYASFQGVAKVFASGANTFFDRVYNLQWIVAALQVAGFNALAQVSTKIPQTEPGVRILKSAYRKVCEQGVTNQFLAPGDWNSPVRFGDEADMLENISQRGYFIYSAPVALQSAADRADRKAPLIQIAIKEAGAIDSTNVIVNVNA